MPRLPYAAETLQAEVLDLFPDAEMEPQGDPDGLDVHRDFRFDKATSAQIAEAVSWLGDKRVSSVNVTDAGYLHVSFSPRSPLADDRKPFMLKIALDVLAGEES